MTDFTPTDWRALCARMADELDHYRQLLMDDRRETHALAAEARAALAQTESQGATGRPAIEPDGPAVPDGREPASVTDQPTDKELLALMPETMKDEFSYAAKVCSDATGGQVKPRIFRVALNTAALEYAQAVLQRYGRPAIEPVPVSERLPGPEDCDAKGRCWWLKQAANPEHDLLTPTWHLQRHRPAGSTFFKYTHWLPHWALPVPGVEGKP